MVIQIKERNLNKNNQTPLHMAIEDDLDEIAELLISKGGKLNIIDIIYQMITQ